MTSKPRAGTRSAPPAVPVSEDPRPRLDPAEAQAFTEQARWLHAYHDKRSETIGSRAATLLGFVGVITTLLLGGLNLGKGSIHFTLAVRANVVLVLLLVLAAAFFCLRTMTLRNASIPGGAQLRAQWESYAHGELRGLVHAQIAHSYLGGGMDPVADAKAEADSRATSYQKAGYAFGGALLSVGVLTAQALLQQVGRG